jgi:GT2 family glycosyltransferase/glycosyltransferase involved in cell wall biosynthesis
VFEYDYRFQRPQQLAVQFAEAGHRVFWISPSRFLPPSSPNLYALRAVHPGIWEVQLRARIPNIYNGRLSDSSVCAIADALSQLYLDAGIAESSVIVELPFWRRIGLALSERHCAQMVYDCMDRWETFPEVGVFTRTEQEPLTHEARPMIVTGQGLHDTYASEDRRPVVIRNGVDFAFFKTPSNPGRLESIAGPIVGYYGAIANWFDFDLVEKVARLRPQYSFVLIGGAGLENNVTGKQFSRLRRLPNVHLLGHRPYLEMPDYLAGLDVCTVPFVLNAVTAATDPVKLYEYFSQGKPVVATQMSELSQCGDLVYLAAGAEEFAARIDAALGEEPSLKQRRIEFAASNTWKTRFEMMDSAIRNAAPKVSVLIACFNNVDFLPSCLDSVLRDCAYPNLEVVVVDNGSTDGSLALLEHYAADYERLRVISSSINLGFAGANNRAAAAATGEFLVLLNTDTIVPRRWLSPLLRHFRDNREIGILLPVTNWAGNEAKIRVSYTDIESMNAFATHLAGREAGRLREIRCAPLFAAVIPASVWRDVGNLDEGFGVGMFEDDDYSIRVRQAGLRVVLAEDCFVHHFGKGAFAKLPAKDHRTLFDSNLAYFEKKWRTKWQPHQYRAGITDECGCFKLDSFVNQRPTRQGGPAAKTAAGDSNHNGQPLGA